MPLAEPPDWTEGCPDPLILIAYSLGKLPGEMVERVASHVSVCTRCEALLPDTSGEEDSLVQDLRQYVAGGQSAGEVGQATTESRGTVSDAKAPAGGAAAGLPAWLGQYELLELVGQGGMGVVYKARQGPPLNRVVAVKLALGGPVPGTEAFTRFQTEIAVIARLQHDNIVRVYECGEHAGRPYFSMDYVEGGSLAQRLAGKPLPEREAASLVQTLARTVHFAHQRQVIHRDLKPGNVLIGPDGVVKLTDFGLAKLLDAEDGQTQSHVVMGTAAYMAPEQARGNTREVGPLADVYGLGTILYEALTGRPPFKAATRTEILEQVRSQEPLPPSRLRPRMSRDLEAVCQKCLAKDPTKRYARAEELAEDLARWLRGEPTKARPRRWFARVYRAARKHPIGALLGVVILCTPIMLYLRDPERPVKEVERMLSQGQPVSLIEETGSPRWFRCRLGGKESQFSPAEDGTFSVESWTKCLLELVRDPQQDRYVIQGQVRHMESDFEGAVGIYLAHRAYPSSQADIQVFFELSFNDVKSVESDMFSRIPADFRKPEPPPGNVARLVPYLYFPRQQGPPWEQWAQGVVGPPFKAAGMGGGPWHDLVVIVAPEGLQASWDGQLMEYLPAAKIVDRVGPALKRLRQLCPDDPLVQGIPAEYQPRGALGLYVYRGSARFRSFRITPDTEPH